MREKNRKKEKDRKREKNSGRRTGIEGEKVRVFHGVSETERDINVE